MGRRPKVVIEKMSRKERRIDDIKRRLAEIGEREVELLRFKRDHQAANLLLYFNKEGSSLRANPLQAELIEAWDDATYRVFTYTGSNRLGKTTILVIVSFAVLNGAWPWSGRKIWFPHTRPRKIRLVGQDWEKHIKSVLIPDMKKWWPREWGEIDKVARKNNQGVEAYWTHPNGGTLEIMSNMQDAALHEGWSGDLVGYDEPPKREIRVANARGLIDRQGRELFCMTLLKEAWVDHEVIKARNADGTPDRTVFNVSGDITFNIGYGITAEGVEQFKKTLTDDEIQSRIHGKPSYLSGLVCKRFSRKVHLKRRFDIPLGWIVDIAIDAHPRKEQAVLFMATSPKQERWLFREIWKHGSGTDIGEWIVRAVNRDSMRVGKIICDPLAKGDSNNENTTFDKIDRVLSAHGYTLYTATKDKESGIIEINNHLMSSNDEASLFVFDDMVRTVFEFESWMYDEDSQKPQKVNDDMMENLYRLLLENTVWYPVEDEEEADVTERAGGSSWTGY